MNHQRTRQRPASAPVKTSKQTSTRKSRAPLDNLGSDYNQKEDKFKTSKSDVSSRNATRFVRNDAASIMKIDPTKPSNSTAIPKTTRKGRKNDNKSKSSPSDAVSPFGSVVSNFTISPTSSISSSGSIRTNASSSSSLQQKISERRRELRSFIQQQREIRKSEREMKQSIADEIEKQENIQQGAPYMGHALVENVVENKILENEQIPMGSPSSLKRVHFYEGPPEMSQEEEPTYTNIRKKLTSPILKNNTKQSDETISGRNASPDGGVFDSNHTVVSSKAPENEFVTSSSSNILANTKGSMFSFFVTMEAPPPLPNPEDQPVHNIIIGNYAESAFLEFGDESMNIVGKSKSLPFDLTLPTDAKYRSVNLKVEKVPIKKGFSLGLVSTEEENHSSRTGLVLQRGETKRMFLTWTPVEQGGVCEVVYLKLPRGRVRVTARGNARSMKTLQNQCSKTHNGKFFKANKARNMSAKTLPSTNSMLGKEQAPNPTYRNKSYDQIRKAPEYSCAKRSWDSYKEDFASQQCESFAKWLNHMFQAPEIQNEGKYCGKSLRTILSRRRHVKACEKAQKLYNSAEMKRAREVIKNEVESQRLEVRSDHDVFANVSLRSQMISLLMSYSTSWLCLGLETVFGQVIDFTASNSSIDNRLHKKSNKLISKTLDQRKITKRAILKSFIVDRLLSDPYLKLKYTGGKCNVPSGRFERQYKNELNKHILMSTLNLIVFLDAAKQQHVIDSTLLFLRKSSVKSSRAVLNVICRDYISGIGNLFKHLSHLQINVSHEQSPLEELEFSVLNLATDLRDGSRLGKLAELLSNRHNILEEMRLPAVSRLQKVHNVSVALRHLSQVGIPNVSAIHPNYIVDGHRPQVLKMLWSIISSCQLENVIRKGKLRHEIYNIHSANEHRKEPYNFSKHCGNIETCSDVCQLLLIWCDSICSTFGYDVTDFSRSFYDGVAPLLLIAYYHPSIVNLKSILPTSNYNRESLKSSEKVMAISNEHHNCHLSQEKMHSLGGIPNMFPISDMDNLPDERSVIVCIAYLCARLLESSEELNAIIIIQTSFRKHLVDRLERLKKGAALTIERFWLQNKKKYFSVQRDLYLTPIKKIESFLFSHRPKLKVMQRRRLCCVKIQKLFRGYRTRCLVYQISRETKAAIVIQAIWRRSLQHMVLTLTRKAAIHIQAIVRGVQSRMIFAQKRDNVIKIQRFLKRRLAERSRSAFIRNVVTCQGIVRRRHAQKRVRHMKDESEVALCQYRCNCAIKIQAVWRQYIHIQRRNNMNHAATLIQRWFRASVAKNDSISFYSCNTSCMSGKYSSDVPLHEISSVSMYPKGTSFNQKKDNLTNKVNLPKRSPHMNELSGRYLHVLVHEDTKFSGSLYNNSFIEENDMNISQKESAEKTLYYGVNKQGSRQISTSTIPVIVDSDLMMTCDQDSSFGMVPFGSDPLDANSTKYLLPRNSVDDKSAMEDGYQVSHSQPNKIYECSSLKEAKSSPRSPHSRAMGESEKFSQRNFSQNESIHSNRTDPNVKDEIIDTLSATSPTRDAIPSHSYSRTSSPRESILVERYIKHHVEGHVVKNLPNDYHALKEEAATKIQSHWRKFYAFVQYQFDLSDIVFIQSLVRKRIAQNVMRKRYMSIKLIQTKVKTWLERRITIRNTSATMIQKYWRRYAVNMDYKVLVHATLVIQQAIRSRLKLVRRLGVVKATAASQIQRIWRGYSKYLEFNMSVAAVTTIQRNYQAYRLKVIQNIPDVISQSEDIDPIQFELTSDYQFSRRTCGARTKKQGKPFITQHRDDENSHSFQQIKTDSRFESRNCSKLEPFAVQDGLEERSIVKCSIAGHVIKKSGIQRGIIPTYQEKKEAVINSNGGKTRMSVNVPIGSKGVESNEKQAAPKSIKIPHLKGERQFSTIVDGTCRDADAENDSCNKMNAVFASGSPDITSRVLDNPRNDEYRRKKPICFMSKGSYSKVENFQLSTQSQNVRSGMPNEHNLVKKIQNRKVCESSTDVKGSSHKVSVAKYLTIMKTSEKLRDVIQAAKSLEMWTKSSYISCKMLITSESVEVLYSLIRACNRSVPHVELLEYILETLFHVTKYEDLIPSICSESLVETLVDLLQLFRDKDDIFCYAAIILKRIVLTGKEALNACRKPDNLNRLLGIYQIREILPGQDKRSKFDGEKRIFLTKEISGLKNLELVIKACHGVEKI